MKGFGFILMLALAVSGCGSSGENGGGSGGTAGTGGTAGIGGTGGVALTPCEVEGCTSGEDCAFCQDGNSCTADVCVDAGDVATCPNAPLASGTTCPDHSPAAGACDGAGTCQLQECFTNSDCAPAEPENCLAAQTCDVTTNLCNLADPGNEGGACTSSGSGSGVGTCDAAGVCVSADTCQTDADCSDDNGCTDDVCSGAPLACSNPNLAEDTACDAGGGPDSGACDGAGLCVPLTPCELEGCTPDEDCVFCEDGNSCTSNACVDAGDEATCPNDPLASGTICPDHTPAGGQCDGAGVCEIQGCNIDADCPAADPDHCLAAATCDTDTNTCNAAGPGNEGGACTSSGSGSGVGTCDAAGVCVSTDTCETGADCDDSNDCTDDVCSGAPLACSNPSSAEGTSCNAGTGPGSGACDGAGVCQTPCEVAGCTPGVSCAFCDDDNSCTDDICVDAGDAATCRIDQLPPTTSCSDFAPAAGACDDAGVCVLQGCNSDTDCAPAKPNLCLAAETCDLGTYTCNAADPGNEGGACTSSGSGSGLGTCDAAGVCVSTDMCQTGADCDDSNDCTDDVCSGAPLACSHSNLAEDTACDAGGGPDSGACDVAGVCNPHLIAVGDGFNNWKFDTNPANGVMGATGGCTVVVGSTSYHVAVFIDFIASSDGANNLTTDWVVTVAQYLLPSIRTQASLDGLAVNAIVRGATPIAIPSGLTAAATGQLIDSFLNGDGDLQLASLNGDITQGSAALTPTGGAGSQVTVNWDGNFALEVTLDGAPITVDRSMCAPPTSTGSDIVFDVN